MNLMKTMKALGDEIRDIRSDLSDIANDDSETTKAVTLDEKELKQMAKLLGHKEPAKKVPAKSSLKEQMGLRLLDKPFETKQIEQRARSYTTTPDEKTRFEKMMAFGRVYDYCVAKGWVTEKKHHGVDVIQKKKRVVRFLKEHPERDMILAQIKSETGVNITIR